MIWFKKDKVEEQGLDIGESTFGRVDPEAKEDSKSKQVKSSAKYSVVIKESLGSITRTVKTIEAERFIDEDDHVVYLRSTKDNFLEVFPEDHVDFINLDDATLVRKMEEIKELLKNPKRMKEKDINPHNLEFDLMKYGAKRRSLKYGREDSYVSFDSKGKPEFYYLRKGSTFFPFKWDTDTSTIYTASDNKKKKSILAIRNKESKYRPKKLIEVGTVVFLIINIVLAAVLIWGFNKQFKTYDESEIAAIKRACVDQEIQSAQAIRAAAQSVQAITKEIEGGISKPNIILDGLLPK